MTRAIVLGGGVAGITAAFALRDSGHEVELWESRGWLGGRAFSLPRKLGQLQPDNGPHVMLGCYVRMRALLRRIGTEAEFDRPKALELAYAAADGTRAALALPRLISPLALPWAVVWMRGVPRRTRWQALRGMLSLPFGARRDWSLAQWIERRGQSGGARSWFWDPLCRAIMNAEAEHVSAKVFLRTLQIAFGGWPSSAAIWSPRRPWSEILGEPARMQLEREGVTVHDGRRVIGLTLRDGAVGAVECAGQPSVPIDPDTVVVSALPWHAFGPLVGAAPATELRGSPIVSVYFENTAAEGLPEDPVVALVDGEPFHFLCRRPGAPRSQFALLSGGDRSLDGQSVAQIEARGREQLARHFPRARCDGGLTRVVREDRATFVAAPEEHDVRMRPGRHPAARNLWVCGDWTQTQLPATLEGAVRSAEMAVRGMSSR